MNEPTQYQDGEFVKVGDICHECRLPFIESDSIYTCYDSINHIAYARHNKCEKPKEPKTHLECWYCDKKLLPITEENKDIIVFCNEDCLDIHDDSIHCECCDL